jgi:dTDP-4-amino-4,6-dideoxygalactose transaminase
MYNDAFADLPVGLPIADQANTVHAHHLYTLMIDEAKVGKNRDLFMQQMHNLNIGTGVHYVGVHLHPYYRERFGYKPESFPNATWVSERTVSIPLSPGLSNSDIELVIEAVRRTSK